MTPLRRLFRPRPATGPVARPDYGLWTVDRSLHALAAACDREGRGVPAAQAVLVGTDTLRILLGTPDERPPAGWSADQDGRVWQARLRDLQHAVVADGLPDPYPRLVALGDGAEGFVLLNLGLAGGVIGLEGDGRRARALALDWAGQLAASPWGRGVRVVRVGFRPAAPGADDVRTLFEAEPALADEAGGVLLLAGAPRGRDGERVRQLAEDPLAHWSVVVAGRVDDVRWRFTVDAAGAVQTGLLDGPVMLRPAAEAPDDLSEPTDVPAGAAAEPAGGSRLGSAPRSGGARRRLAMGAGVVAVLGTAGIVIALVSSGGSKSSASSPIAAGSAPAPTKHSTSKPHPSQTPATSAPADTPTPAAAPAAVPPGSLLNPGTGKCLSGSAGSDGTPLILFECNGDVNQKWNVRTDGTIRTKGLCMDAAWAATAPGTVVQIANCHGDPAQQFSMRGGTIYAKAANLCVGVVDGGKGLRLAACDGSPAVTFKQT